MNKSINKFILPCTLVLCGVIIGFVSSMLYQKNMHVHPTAHQVRGESEYQFINPLLECEIANGAIDASKQNFNIELQKHVEQEKKVAGVSNIAVYFRDLNNGPAFGFNENEKFIPASLLKVPVMMAYYHLADDDSSILKKVINFDKSREEAGVRGVQIIAPKEMLVPGTSYTIEELIHRSIVYSDNQAVTLLIEQLPGETLRKLYRMLGVDESVLNGPDGRLSVREYAAFFRVLFNSSYLSQENSEKSLELLSKTDFPNALIAGAPSHVVIAHKFGEGGDEIDHQIHDCGIVYYPGNPYLLCIMTRGGDISVLEGAIANISRFVYEKVDAQYAK